MSWQKWTILTFIGYAIVSSILRIGKPPSVKVTTPGVCLFVIAVFVGEALLVITA